ncbi:hypothetical protein ACFL54_01395 [Planctomycetota bacterium]
MKLFGCKVTVQTGPSWYRFEDESGKPMGYAWYEITMPAEDEIDIQWKLRLAFPEGTYEEDRSMLVSGKEGLLSASYYMGGDLISEAKREGNKLTGRAIVKQGGDFQTVEVELKGNAVCGMQFVLAAFMPLEVGAGFENENYSEAAGFTYIAPGSMKCAGWESIPWQGGQIEVCRFDLDQNGTGNLLPIWVNRNREIVKVDWGGGNVMVLAEKSTEHLFEECKNKSN